MPGPFQRFSPLQGIRGAIREGRDRIHSAGTDIRGLADEIRGSPSPPTEAPTAEKSVSPHLTNEETVAYQKREIGKQLLAMESHYAQRMRIAGVPCDCGATKHLLYLEGLCQETIPMVNDPSPYEEILQWVKEVEPKSTEDAATSGKFDEEYPGMSGEARDFRKKVMGTLSPAAMIESGQQLTLEEAKKLASEEAEREVEKRWGSQEKK